MSSMIIGLWYWYEIVTIQCLSTLDQHLNSVHVSWVVLAHLSNFFLSLALHQVIILALALLLVLQAEVEVECGVQRNAQRQQTDGSAVSRVILGCSIGTVEEGRDNARDVADGDLHTTSEGSLAVTRVIVVDPGKRGASRHPEAECNDEGADVAQYKALVDDQENVAKHTNGQAADAEYALLLNLVTIPRADNVRSKAGKVDWDGHGLDDLVAPTATHTSDDSRKEDRETVQHAQTDELTDGIGIRLPVLCSVPHILLVHFLAGLGLTNFGHAKGDKVAAIFFCEKLGGLRAVGKDKRCDNGGDNSWDTIDQDDLADITLARVSHANQD
jgi:hypothetical protein